MSGENPVDPEPARDVELDGLAHIAQPEASMAAELEPHLLEGARRHTRDDVARLAGVPAERATALWVALGFPANQDPTAVEFTDADIAALQLFSAMDFARTADPRLALSFARTVGQAMARLAEWQVDVVLNSPTTQTVDQLQWLQSYAWRRHLAAALARALADGAPGGSGLAGSSAGVTGTTTRDLAVGFADMVSFTRLTRHLDPGELAALLEEFEASTTQAITAHGGWAIKNVGDEVMFAAETPLAAARIALAIQAVGLTAGEDRTPVDFRVGVAYGPVLMRFGDLFGSVVNIAARLTGVARPGTVLIDDRAADTLTGRSEFDIRHLRSVRVRGFSRLHSHVLRPSRG
ncbi:MAG: adenylate/guanylate cyclase domain-containing protein [Mycobacteriaceae bacterium]|nr:adenylate/guanylate cyclase domain-containing protein [Mycobacteriaceae bacterium]